MIVQLLAWFGSKKKQAVNCHLNSVPLVCFVLFYFLSTFPNFANAQGQQPYRVLLLHGVWDADEWEHKFDNALVDFLKQSEFTNIEISRFYLGLDATTSTETATYRKNYIEAQIRELEVSLIVTVLPGASDFLLSLDLPASLPRLLVLPDSSSEEIASGSANTAVVASSASMAMRNTIEQIRLLKPDISFIDVMAGSDITDRSYLEIAQELSADYQANFTFRFHIGENPAALEQYVRELDASTVILDLPFESYTLPSGEQASLSREAYRRILQASSVPVFGFYENEIGSGLTGGFISSTSSYANAAARQVLSQVASNNWLQSDADVGGRTVYDWELVQRFNLNLDRLGVEYQLVNRPASLFETNRTFVLFAVNGLVLMLLIVIFMGVLLGRSRKARLHIAESERLARESEAKFKILAMNTIDMIWTWNYASNTVGYCSPSVERLTGFTPEEFMSRSPSDLLAPESVKACERLFKDPHAGSKVVELQHYKKDGGTVWCEMSAQPIPGQDKTDTWVGVTRDITQRKQYEADRDVLEASIRQNQKFESLGTLAGGIAHDFNNILAVIVGITDMLSRELADNEKASGLLGKLESSTQRATALVRQILTFSRQSDGNRVVVSLAELINESIQILHAGIPQSVSFETHIDDPDLHVLADRIQIEQVVMNIVTNSLQALDGSSGEISLRLSSCEFTNPREFTHGGIVEGAYALIEVTDTGSGISASQIDKIFDPFFTSKELGNGMGLAIVRGVVIKHGGAVKVQSQLGKGTTFSIYLPLTEQSLTVEPEQLPGSAETIRRRILVIDDQLELLEIITMMIETLGHEVISSSDPAKALGIIASEGKNLDLVITDYSMPDITGLQIIKACAEEHPDLGVVLCSGFGESLPESVEQLTHSKIPVLQKPLSMDTLEAMLKDMFSEEETLEL